jgi:lysophospholipase L1-like esterase
MQFSLPRAVHLACGPLAFVAALLSLTVCFAAQPSRLPHVAARLAAHQPLRIVALGSSSTEGVGASAPDRTYPAVLQALLARDLPEQVAVLNHGIGGEDVDDMMRRLPGVIAERPDLVIWQTGSNDALRGVPIDRFEAETRAGIVQLRDAGIDVMLMEPQLSQRLADTPGSAVYLEAVRSLGQALGVPVLDEAALEALVADGSAG